MAPGGTPPPMTQGKLAGKTVLISGGASGIGLATARRALDQGAHVAIGDIDAAAGERAARETPGLHFVRLNVTSDASWAAAVADTRARFPAHRRRGEQRWNLPHRRHRVALGRGLETNALGQPRRRVLRLPPRRARDESPRRLDREHVLGQRDRRRSQRAGLQLIEGRRPDADQVGRAALCAQRLQDPLQLGSPHVRRHPDVPRHPRTRARARTHPRRAPGAGSPRPPAEPHEIADLLVYLLSDESAFVTGAEMVIDGGLTAQ